MVTARGLWFSLRCSAQRHRGPEELTEGVEETRHALWIPQETHWIKNHSDRTASAGPLGCSLPRDLVPLDHRLLQGISATAGAPGPWDGRGGVEGRGGGTRGGRRGLRMLRVRTVFDAEVSEDTETTERGVAGLGELQPLSS